MDEEHRKLSQEFSASSELRALKENFSQEVVRRSRELFDKWRQKELENQKRIR